MSLGLTRDQIMAQIKVQKHVGVHPMASVYGAATHVLLL